MAKNFEKLNDLARSNLRKRYIDQEFLSESNLAVGMGRVSTKGQKDHGQSDAAQLEEIERYSGKMNLKLVKVWDVAESASKHHRRHNFIEMLDYVRANTEIKHVVFSHQSRSNRNRESAREIEQLIRSQGVTLHCARDNLQLTEKSSLEDWLRWDLFNNLNEKFIKDHTRNVMDGIIKRIEMGLSPNKAPFGYKNFRRPSDQLSVFIQDEHEARFMKKAFELCASGNLGGKPFSEAELKRVVDREFPNLKRPITAKLFSTLLRNPFYFGDFMYDDVQYKGNPEFHPPLVSFELWKKAQDRLNDPLRLKPRVTERSHPYIGLVRCGGRILDAAGNETDEECGAAITGEEKRKTLADGSVKTFYYWHCSRTSSPCSHRNSDFMKSFLLGKLYYPEHEFEMMLGAMFQRLKFPPEVCEWMIEILHEHHRDESQEHEEKLKTLKTRHSTVGRYMDQAYVDKLSGDLPEDIWRKKNGEWMIEKEQLAQQIASFNGDSNEEAIAQGSHLIELLQHIENTYKIAKPEIKRRLVDLISSNRVLRGGTIEYYYEKPFDILADCVGKEGWWR